MTAQILDLEVVLRTLRLATDTPSELQLLQLNNVVDQVRPYAGNWEFPWLLTPWSSSIWETTNGAKTRRNENGQWIDAATVSWDLLLPDGVRLTDPPYADLLETCRKICALVRNGNATRTVPSISFWHNFNQHLLKICSWMVLHKSRYLPAEHGFKLFDQFGTTQLFSAVGRGGWCEAHSLIERCMNELHLRVFNKPASKSFLKYPANLSQNECEQIIEWLRRNDGYAMHRNKDTGRVSRVFLGTLINAKRETLNHQQLDVVLRQFEAEHQHVSTLPSGSLTTEYPSQNTPLIAELMNKCTREGTVKALVSSFRVLLSLYKHLPDQLPSPVGIDLKKASSIAYAHTAASGHTPFVPIDLGLKLLNQSLKWITLYGDHLIDYFLSVTEAFMSQQKNCDNPESFRITRDGMADRIFASTPLPSALADAGFSFLSYRPSPGTAKDFARLRQKPCLEEALGILIGAVVIAIGLIKPSREMELCTLPINCLSRAHDGLYWLNSKLGKRTRGEGRAMTGGKPIPYVTARAIQQIYKLNRGLTRIFGETDEYKRDLLFYLPNARKFGSAVKMHNLTLNSYLDLFCDFLGLPPDEFGRRWYIRIHEMRKWFLLLLFWSGRYDVLDAARWIAGHTSPQHLYSYIEREFPGEQLGTLEAECAIDLLAHYDKTQICLDGESVGLVQLYERVLGHFRVTSLSFVKESDWGLFVKVLFEEQFHLEPYTVLTDDDREGLCVAVRVGPR